MKRIITFIIMVSLFIGIVACSKEQTSATTFVTLRINPEVGLFLDENQKVVDTIALNSDADVLLSDVNLNGEDVEDAASQIVDEATQCGYIDSESEDTTVFVDVEGEEEIKENINKKITDGINKYFQNKGMFGKVSQETLDKYTTNATELNLSTGKTKMILLALDLNPDLNIDDLKDMAMNELVKLCHNNAKDNNYGYKLNNDFKAERNTLKEKYSELFSACTRLDEITKLLENSELTTEEKTALEEEKVTLEAKRDELKPLYEAEMKTLKGNYQTKKQEYKNECKANKTEKENKQNK